MKKFSILLMGVLLIGGIVAAGITLNDATFTTEKKITTSERVKGNVTFTVDGKQTGYCYLDEPNMNIDDDFEECVNKKYPDSVITNVKDWTDRTYKEVVVNGTSFRSFDDSKLSKIEKPPIVDEPLTIELEE